MCCPAHARFELLSAPCEQIPWEEDFTHSTARELFGSNLLALTWIKGEPLPDDLVNDILRGLELERDTLEERHRRSTGASDAPVRFVRSRSSIERQREGESESDDEGVVIVS